MKPTILSIEAYRHAVAVRDLTSPAQGPHAMQVLVDAAVSALRAGWACDVIVERANPIVPIEDNYDRLHYPADGVARDVRYTRYVSERLLLRTQTSAMIPPLLQRLAADPPADVLLACPGIVYRRDTIDRLHTGEPHQLDLWRVSRRARLGAADLDHMIAVAVGALLPGHGYRTTPAVHPYTRAGRQIDVYAAGQWVEIGECGLALPALLGDAGLDPAHTTGLAMGLGLDRILMLRKGIDDIRLLRASDPRIQAQMQDLSPYRPVSDQPAVGRDLSIATAGDTTPEELGDRVRAALGSQARCVEQVEVVSETPYEALPPQAVARLGMEPGQKNVLVRVVLRDLERTLTHAEANALRNQIYRALHEGSQHQWA
jgi:phenylalanyl-tRNA synthetase alpha chain